MSASLSLFTILSLLFLSAGAARSFRDGQPLAHSTHFQELSSHIQTVLPEIKAATVCIQLEDGASGSGVIISPEGLILSAAHVTQEVGKSFSVILEDGTTYEAVGLGLDTSTDASMAKILREKEGAPLSYVNMSNQINLGQYTLALGHSGGFDAARGSVLRLGRVIYQEESSIRTDGSLIGGDSGGPLFNLDGELIAIHSRVGTVTSSNTHVPLQTFQENWEALLDGALLGDGTFANAGIPFLGMQLLEREGTLYVFSVTQESRADLAKVLRGDVLLSVNGEPMSAVTDLLVFLKGLEVSERGVELELTFKRDEEQYLTRFHFEK